RPSSSPYVALDCADGDAAAVDRLLFGQPAGVLPTDLESVTADSCIAAARGGTLFLHNVTELRASAQAQLARIARDGEVRIDGAPVATAIRLIGSASAHIDAHRRAPRLRL